MNKTAEITQVAVLACLGCLIKSSYCFISIFHTEEGGGGSFGSIIILWIYGGYWEGWGREFSKLIAFVVGNGYRFRFWHYVVHLWSLET